MTFSETNAPATSDKLRNFPSLVNTNQWPRLKANIVANHVFQNTAGTTGGFAEDQSGFHTVIQYQNQASDPSTIADAGQQYTKTVGGVIENFYMTSAGVAKQITGKFSKAARGYCFIPHGFLLQWGNDAGTWNGGTSITYPVAFSTAPYSITANALFVDNNTREFVQVSSIGTTTWTPRLVEDGGGAVSSSRTLYWMAIGLA